MKRPAVALPRKAGKLERPAVALPRKAGKLEGSGPLSALALAACLAISISCRPPDAPKRAPIAESRWQDVFDVAPEVLVVIRPNALRESALYGPLLRRVQELARERSRAVAATRAMDAIEDADEVLFGLYSIDADDADSIGFVMAVVGVRADIDPATLVDADGSPLWTPGPTGPVRELLHDRDEHGQPIEASLFELPGRTWVIASGHARTHAREAFARPRGRSDPAQIDPEALALLRIDGPALTERVPALRPPSPLAALGRKLQWVSFELVPSAGSPIHALFAYSSPDAAAAAESVARDAIDAIRRKKPDGFQWIGDATLDRPAAGSRVALSAPLPAGLLSSLQRSGGATR